MDAESVAIYFRGGERLIALAGALLLITFGVLLFKWGISGTASLIAQHDNLKFQFLNASPGLFCFLFGTILIVSAQWRPLKESLAPSGSAERPNSATTTSPPGGGAGSLVSAEKQGGMVLYSKKLHAPILRPPAADQILKVLREKSAEAISKDLDFINKLKRLADVPFPE